MENSAVQPSYAQVADLFKSLAHPVRLQILSLLGEGEMCVCHIEAALGRRQAYVSQQLMTLREAGLVDYRRSGLQVYYHLTDPQIITLLRLTLGASQPGGIQRITGCSCPSCSPISPESIPIMERVSC
jgi:ArsR family transcriptional regulator